MDALDDSAYRDLIELSGDMVYVIRTAPDAAVEYVSENHVFVGWSSNDLVRGGMDLMLSLIDPRDVDDLLQSLSIEPGQTTYCELRWRHPRGHLVFAQQWMRKRRRADGSEVVEGISRRVPTLGRLGAELRASQATEN